jgi:hypothetical protein
LAWSGWCAVDVDDWTPEGDLNDTLIDKFGLWDFICYSTASSLEKLPKFRLVFRLDRNIQQDEIKHFWWALNTELDSIGDRQTKDLSRMYYVPANYSSAFNFIFRNTGIPIDVDELLARHKYDDTRDSGNFLDRLPDEWRKQIIEHRKSSLENTEYSWSGYYDCPFWPKKLASDYTTINNTGWYHKMYQIMIAVAGKAVEKGYPITSKEIEDLCRAFDNDHGRWYENRAIEKEANNALEYVYRNGVF